MTIEEILDKLPFTIFAITTVAIMPLINRIDLYYKIRDLELSLDKKIPLKVPFVLPYLAYFPYFILGWAYLVLFYDDIWVEFTIVVCVMGIVTGIVNLLFPTHAPREYVYGKNIFSRLIRWHYGQDRPLTAFPSLHVAHSVAISFFLIVVLPEYAAIWVLISALIAISTLFTKEHFLLDVVGGTALGVLSCFAVLYYTGF